MCSFLTCFYWLYLLLFKIWMAKWNFHQANRGRSLLTEISTNLWWKTKIKRSASCLCSSSKCSECTRLSDFQAYLSEQCTHFGNVELQTLCNVLLGTFFFWSQNLACSCLVIIFLVWVNAEICVLLAAERSLKIQSLISQELRVIALRDFFIAEVFGEYIFQGL